MSKNRDPRQLKICGCSDWKQPYIKNKMKSWGPHCCHWKLPFPKMVQSDAVFVMLFDAFSGVKYFWSGFIGWCFNMVVNSQFSRQINGQELDTKPPLQRFWLQMTSSAQDYSWTVEAVGIIKALSIFAYVSGWHSFKWISLLHISHGANVWKIGIILIFLSGTNDSFVFFFHTNPSPGIGQPRISTLMQILPL